MKRSWESGGPAFLAILLVLVVELLSVFTNVYWQYEANFEVISNTWLFLVAIFGFFYWGMPSKDNSSVKQGSILGNIMIPIIAFLMNIDVFGHTIHLEHLLRDLWGWHFGWLICFVIQVLCLTELGKKILELLQKIGHALIDAARVSKNIILSILKINKVILVGILFWIAYIIAQIYYRGAEEVFEGANFCWKSIQCLTVYFFAYILLSNIRLIGKKIKDAISDLKGKKIFWGLAVAVFVVVINLFPSILQTIGICLLILLMLLCLPFLLLGGIIKAGRWLKNSNPKVNKMYSKIFGTKSINLKDLGIFLIAFWVIPLTVLCATTMFRLKENPEIIPNDLGDVATWLALINEVVNVCENFLNFFF